MAARRERLTDIICEFNNMLHIEEDIQRNLNENLKRVTQLIENITISRDIARAELDELNKKERKK